MKRESRLEPVLSNIEFPGEEESLIRTWLESRDFADTVVRKSRRLRVVSHHSVMWGSSLIAVTGAGILAARSPVLAAAGGRVALFACLLFGVLTTATVVGFLATLHSSWYGERRRGEPRGEGRRSEERHGDGSGQPHPQTRP